MSSFEVREVVAAEFPSLLLEIPQPPKTLNFRGQLPPKDLPLLAIVGARKYSTYGKQVLDYLIDGLREYRVGIVSGLALGIDSLAHEAALRNQLYTLAIPGSGINPEAIYPRTHLSLSEKILEANGALLSEFEPNFKATKWSFIQRNRLMAGIAVATLVVEATEQSGTLTTARMCVDYNRELLVVPGNIFSSNSKGPHLFLKIGATPVTCAEDIVNNLKLELNNPEQKASLFTPSLNLTPNQNLILTQLTEPTSSEDIISNLNRPTPEVNALLMEMEMNGLIASENGIYRRLI